MNRSASLPLVIQSLRPVSSQSPSRSVARVAMREGVAARAGLRQRVGADRVRRPASAGTRASDRRVPQRSSALMTSVFCTSTRTPIDGSTRDSASTASTAWKKVAPPPPNASGISMPMTPRSNSLSMSCAGNLRVLVHLAHERPDLAIREFVDAVAEQRLVFGQRGQRGGGHVGVLRGHGEMLHPPLKPANVPRSWCRLQADRSPSKARRSGVKPDATHGRCPSVRVR